MRHAPYLLLLAPIALFSAPASAGSTGTAEVLTERPLLEEIWNTNPLLRQYLGSLDNPMLIVYRIRPARVRYMVEWALEYYEVAV